MTTENKCPYPVPTPEDINAFINRVTTCIDCGEPTRSWLNSRCSSCEWEHQKAQRIKRKQDWLDDRSSETLEGRIRFIEEWIYQHQENHPERVAVFK